MLFTVAVHTYIYEGIFSCLRCRFGHVFNTLAELSNCVIVIEKFHTIFGCFFAEK